MTLRIRAGLLAAALPLLAAGTAKTADGYLFFPVGILIQQLGVKPCH